MVFDDDKLKRLLSVGRSLVTELDPEAVLNRVLREARDMTGARYVALGVLNENRDELERFVTLGIDQDRQRAIGDLPRGRGVLGVLITDPHPLRLSDVGRHPRSYGFPAGHPEMHGFLGVPIVIRGEAWGNLYLTEKQEGSGEFTEEDEEAVVLLAGFAATAIDNARLYQATEARRAQLEHAVHGLEAARDIADAIGGSSDLDRIFELIVKRGRALIDARALVIMLREGDELVVVAAAGEAIDARGKRIPLIGSSAGEALERRQIERIGDARRLRIAPAMLGIHDAHAALLVPMAQHGTGLGVLAAFDRGDARENFTEADEQLMQTFAASAVNAIAISRSVEADRLRGAIAAADAERSRWARELHDETLQALGGLRVALASALRRDDPDANRGAMRQAIQDAELGIENLRAIIADLRPSSLDDLGLVPAIEALVERRSSSELEISLEVSLDGSAELGHELETTVYRVIQEALTNVVKHAQARKVRVALSSGDGVVTVEVDDDGVGFDTSSPSSGFGLGGMRERMYLAGGTLELDSGEGGTVVRARMAAPHSRH